jgi:hypothetical protein
VGHVRDGSLRRLLDERVAVSDAEARHLDGCARCRRRGEAIAADAAYAASMLDTGSQVPADEAQPAGQVATDEALRQVAARLATQTDRGGGQRQRRVPQWIAARPAPRRWRLAGTTLSGATLAGAGVVLAGVAAAASLSTTVFAPTAVAPVPVSTSDLQPITALLDAGRLPDLRDVHQGSGSKALAFGTVDWTSNGSAQQVGSVAAAEAATGLHTVLPAELPNGVGAPSELLVVPAVSATVHFDARAGSLAGSTLQATVGPAVLVNYGGTISSGSEAGGAGTGQSSATSATSGSSGAASQALGAGSPTTLAVIIAAQPVATSSGASTSQLESFLLSQPGVPPDLAAQLRLLGDLAHTLPVPALPGIDTERTTVLGSPAVAMHDASNAVSGVIWQDRDGTLHAVAGLLDEQDVLGVASQVG